MIHIILRGGQILEVHNVELFEGGSNYIYKFI